MKVIRVTFFSAFQHFFPNSQGIGSYVNGRLVEGSGSKIELHDAATGELKASYLDASEATATEACQVAQKAQAEWWSATHAQRGRILYSIGQSVREHVEPLAILESLSSGKPLRDCRLEALKVAEMFEYYSGWADKFFGTVIPVPTSHLNYTRREPVGVVLQITPWNAPIFTAGWQLAPALAMGNGIVLKPSELTVATSLVLAMLAERAGLPVGLVNVLAGYGHTTAQYALKHSSIAKVVFVGSPSTGVHIARAAGERLLPCVLELGGKSANIVFPDADLDRAALNAQAAIFAGAGQSCVAGSRLLVQRSIYDDFTKKVASGADKIRMGHPLDSDTEVGPINNPKQYAHIRRMVELGIQGGAVPLTAQSTEENGFFVRPTVLSNAHNEMNVARQEIFGPVVVVIPFEDEDEAISIANDTDFGLAGAVWTENVSRAHRMAAKVRAGTFWINGYKTIHVSSPFGGYGLSGYGRSSGMETLYEYTQTKSVWVETAQDPASSFGYL